MKVDLASSERMLDDLIGAIDESDPKARKRLRIIRAATELFAKQGFRKTNVEEIAAHAGVAKGTVYLYFKTKADIVMSAVALEKKEHLRRFAPVLDPAVPARERLRRHIVSVLTMTRDMPLVSRLIDPRELAAVYEELPAATTQDIDRQRLSWIEGTIADAIAPQTLAPTVLRERAQAIIAIMHFGPRISGIEASSGLSLERFAEVFADMLIEGLVPQKAKGEP